MATKLKPVDAVIVGVGLSGTGTAPAPAGASRRLYLPTIVIAGLAASLSYRGWTALAGTGHIFHGATFAATLIGALFIQVGTNLSNDYSDARRGADAEDRLGPVRVTAGGLVPPSQVLVATYVSFGVAVLCGIYLVTVAGWQTMSVATAAQAVQRSAFPDAYGRQETRAQVIVAAL